jgi:hypothetical protein
MFWASEDPQDFRQVDVRVQKNFRLPTVERVGLVVEVINVFNYANFREYEDLYRIENGQLIQTFGRPRWWTGDTGRRVQLGLTVGH